MLTERICCDLMWRWRQRNAKCTLLSLARPPLPIWIIHLRIMDSLFFRQGKSNVFKEFKMLRKSNFHLNVQSAFQYRLFLSTFPADFSTGSLCSGETLSCGISMTIDNATLKSFFRLLVICEGVFFCDEKAIQISRMRQQKMKSHGNFIFLFRRVFREWRKFAAKELTIEHFPFSHCE